MVPKVSLHNSLRTFACLCLWISLCAIFLGQPRAVAQPLCQITDISASYQQPVPPNQPIQLSTIVTGICSPAEQEVFYTVRVDIRDTVRNQVLSMASVPIGYLTVQPSFVVTVPNVITTPNVLSSWQLTIIVYIFVNLDFVANRIDTSAVNNIVVQVGTAQLTTASVALTTPPTMTAMIKSSTNTMTQPTSIINEVQPTSVEPIWQQAQLIVSLTAAAIIVILALALIYSSRRRSQTNSANGASV